MECVDDRALLDEFNRRGEILGPFTGGILTDTLTVAEQLAFGYQLVSVAGLVRARVEKKPTDRRRRTAGGELL